MKPLFIPLKGVYFGAFLHGNKDTEYRLYGPRWSELTCPVGRAVVLSRGYGKSHRLSGTVAQFGRVWGDELPGLLRISLRAIFGTTAVWVACIRIQLQKERGK